MYLPHYASHHISHCTPFHNMYQITPHSMYFTPHFRSRHILATSCASHHISHHIAFYTTLHCIPPHLTVITPDSTSHYHVSHNIPHHTVHYPILHPTTCHISHNTTSTTTHRAVSQPTLSFYIAQGSTFHATAHAPIHITPQLSITPFPGQFEGLEPYK